MGMMYVTEPPTILRGLSAGRVLDIIDAAEAGYTRDLFALYRDVVGTDSQVITELPKRKGAVEGDTIRISPYDKDVEADRKAANACEVLVESESFQRMVSWLLNATLYPVAVMEKVYRPSVGGGWMLAELVEVPYQLLDYTNKRLMISSADAKTGEIIPASAVLPDPNRYIIHRGHSLPVPDNWGGPMRAVLFWWLLRTMDRQWWAEFVERFGRPFLKGKYNSEPGRKALLRAFSEALRVNGLVLSKGTEAEIISTAMSDSVGAHQQLFQTCNDEISKIIVGQTLSSTPAPTGELGGGTARLQGQVRDDMRKSDARMLSVTIRSQLLVQFCQINGLTGRAPLITFGSDSAAEMSALMESLGEASKFGLEPDDAGVEIISERLGVTLRRAAQPSFSQSPFGGGAFPLSATSSVVVPTVDSSADVSLADAFTGRYKPLRNIIEQSVSPDDCAERVRAWLRDNKVNNNAVDVLEQAMAAYAVVGSNEVSSKEIKND